jgi:hypothetical protein
MNLNRRRFRNNDPWGRVFLLLIVLFVGLYFVDRSIGLDGIFQRLGRTETTQPTQTATLPLIFATAEEYVFVPPTQVPQTATPVPSPTMTPTPVLPIELVQVTTSPTVFRQEPLSIIARCDEPYKTTRYTIFDPITNAYRTLTDSIPYLVQADDEVTLALYDGLLQRDLSIDFLDSFAIPSEWRVDMQYAVLAISSSAEAVIIHRWTAESENLYWLSRGSERIVELMQLSNSIEESYTDPANEWLFFRVLNDEGESDLFAIDLTSGGLIPLTAYQDEDAFGGVLSWDGEYFAYWTVEGVWVIKLDGSYGVLAFPNAEQPSWAPDGKHLVMVKEGSLVIGSMELVDAVGQNMTVLPVKGNQPIWSADSATLLYWNFARTDCTLNTWDVAGGFSDTVFRTQNQICQSFEPARWSPQGDLMIVNLPTTGDLGQTSGDILCDLSSGKCEYLRYTAGNYPCRDGQWTTYSIPYVWDFDTPASDWYIVQQLDSLKRNNGSIYTRSMGNTPIINSPRNININADVYPYIEIIMRVTGGQTAQINFVTFADPSIQPERLVQFNLIPDGQMHRYVIDLSSFSYWDGVVKHLRLRPVDEAFIDIEIESIRILPVVEGLN